jgi:replicative DNA helicase
MNANKYVDSESCIQIIGCAMLDPSLLDDDGAYFFNEDDFTSEFHKVIFGAIYNLYLMGATKLDIKTIDGYLKDRPQSYAIFKQGNGPKWLTEVVEAADLNNFDYYYNRVKKMTLLRGYIKVGLDVSWLLDMDNITDLNKKQKQLEYFDNLSLEEVADKLENRILNIRSTYVDNSIEDGVLLGEGMFDLIQSLERTPAVGYPMYGDLINAITKGQRLGKFYMRSAAQGTGKTRAMMADFCYTACDKI